MTSTTTVLDKTEKEAQVASDTSAPTTEQKSSFIPRLFNRNKVVHGSRVADFTDSEYIISASQLTMKSILGTPYENVTFNIKQGEVFAIRGDNGSGKTALLLTCAGRMHFNGGDLSICGHRMPRGCTKVQRRVGMAHFEDLNDIDDAMNVRRAFSAEFELYGRSTDRDDIMQYLREWRLESIAELPMSEVDAYRRVLVYLALAWVSHPDIIIVDDIESELTKNQSMKIMQHLIYLARARNVTIVVGVLERDLANMADNFYELGGEQ